jgi:hypothetical protein
VEEEGNEEEEEEEGIYISIAMSLYYQFMDVT